MTNKELLTEITATYFSRFGYKPQLIETPVQPETKLIVVIPCHDEPDLLATLTSLSHCVPPRYPVEVLVVINAGIGANQQVKESNRETLKQARKWLAENPELPFICHLLYFDDLPKKHAGVGLARKIGMDEALRRFTAVNYPGLIICLDADCCVSENYLAVLEEQFLTSLPGSCGIHFEHPLDEVHEEELRQGIIHYELFLRYYVNALRHAGFPYAMHTVGSSMAVRADIYAKTGGMNRRKAGEDFYFLHKVVTHGHFMNIINAAVYPSARISHRVPFGTGKSQAEWQKNPLRLCETYHFQIFEDLKVFLSKVDEFYEAGTEQASASLCSMSEAVQAFLEQQNFVNKLEEIKGNTSSRRTFRKRFFNWFDGFSVLKFVHFARDHFYASMSLQEAADVLLQKLGKEMLEAGTTEELLKVYRQIDLRKEYL